MLVATQTGQRDDLLREKAFDDLPFAALIFDADAVCQAANPHAIALLGVPVSRSAAALFASWPAPPVLRADMAEARTAVLGDGRTFVCRSASRPDGSLQLMLVDVSAELLNAQRSSRDPLTRLRQRTAITAELAEELARTPEAHLAVHYIDLDRFKAVNDALGHGVGDSLLQKVAERLAAVAGPDNPTARLGGDEFAIVQFGATRASAEALAARLIDVVSRTYVIDGYTLNIGVSVGIALSPGDAADAATLFRHADLALYRAKADGRGVARLFEPAMNARLRARLLLEADLRRALALRQFSLAFQPLMNLASDRVSGFEALLRWNHPERGNVSPADFIPLSEETGLIVAIGEWVLRSACIEAAGWPVPATVAVNISAVQFKTGRLVATVASALAASGLAPERLELEITESALLDETNLVVGALHAIRALGVRISMDDFGTGYSSLSYLRKFPFDKLKIDQSFVRGLGGEGDCDAIVRAIAALAASLGMRTTAEGVETPSQMDRIRQEGCTEVQGYLTGRPMSGSDAAALLTDQHAKGKGRAA